MFKSILTKTKLLIEKVQRWLDISPVFLCLSYDVVLRVKIKTILTKYALYDEITARDICFNGFGLLEIEFLGTESELTKCKLVLEKIIFDYLRSYYLDFARTKADVEQLNENIYIIRVYYAFSKKTLYNFELYFHKLSDYTK